MLSNLPGVNFLVTTPVTIFQSCWGSPLVALEASLPTVMKGGTLLPARLQTFTGFQVLTC